MCKNGRYTCVTFQKKKEKKKEKNKKKKICQKQKPKADLHGTTLLHPTFVACAACHAKVTYNFYYFQIVCCYDMLQGFKTCFKMLTSFALCT